MLCRANTWLLALACLATTAIAQTSDDLFQFLNQMPACGITCTLQVLPGSACRTMSNATCICSDLDFYNSVQDCVVATCNTTLEAIDVARVEAQACSRPKRDRTHEFDTLLVFVVLGWFAGWLRLFARWYTIGKFDHDDWIMLACTIIDTAFIVVGQYSVRIAFGRDIWEVETADLTSGLKFFYVSQSFYLVCLCLTKLSMLFFFLRIFPQQWLRWSSYAVMLVTCLSTTVYLFLQIFQCVPISYNWEGWKGTFADDYQCVDVNKLVVSASGFSIALDAIILALPLPLLLGLNMSWRSKAGTVVMFSLGVFIVVTASLRLQYILRYSRSINPTWDHTDVGFWSGLEVAVSMIVTSLPAIRVMLRKLWPDGWLTTVFSRAGSSANTGSWGTEKKGGSGLRSAGHRKQASAAAAAGGGRGGLPDNQSEEVLELWDRQKGDVSTDIVADPSRDDLREWADAYNRGAREELSLHDAIFMQTTTTTTRIIR